MNNTRTLTQTSLWLAVLIVGSQLAIPIGPVPITLQTLIILLIGLCARPLIAWLVPSLYLVLGLIGLPVFAGWSGGIESLLSPTFGFVIAFVVITPIISWGLTHWQTPTMRQQLVVSLCAMIGIYLIGVGYFYGQQQFLAEQPLSLPTIIQLAVLPFVIIDLGKIALALVIAQRLRPRLNINNQTPNRYQI